MHLRRVKNETQIQVFTQADTSRPACEWGGFCRYVNCCCVRIISEMSLKLSSYKGTRDLYPSDMRLRNYIFNGWRQVAEKYGYQEYMAPLLEPLDVYAAKSGEEIVNDQTYSFVDRGGRQMVIRPEMTPSITRMVAARRQEMPMPARLYSIANFMRYERPQHGREREFWQLNLDVFGIANTYAELEIINMSHDILTHFGATDDMFTIRVNDRRLTDFIMRNYLGLSDDKTTRMIKLLDRYDKLPSEAFRSEACRILDGDEAQLGRLMDVIQSEQLDDLPSEISDNEITRPLRELLDKLHQRGLGNVYYNVRLMRGFDYYTGIVFEAFDEAPENRRAMFGGGRYDGLVGLFGVESLPVVGVAPGETTFMEFLSSHNLLPDLTNDCGPTVTILPMSTDENDYASQLADQLRRAGIITSVDYTDRKLDKKTKVAVKNGAHYVIYAGQDEVAANTVPVKDLSSGQQVKMPVDQVADYLLTQISGKIGDK